MSIINQLKKELTTAINKLGYEIDDVHFQESNRQDLGEYQITEPMLLAKKYHENPLSIAEKIKAVLQDSSFFDNITIAGPGFLNVTFKTTFLNQALNMMQEDIKNNIDMTEGKKIFIDYGGANIAKALHVGHLRSANIGEALKRLARLLGNEVIADVHFGDIGRQSGIVIYEIKRRYPQLNYFDGKPHDSYDVLPINVEDLKEIYPTGSLRAKEDEAVLNEVRDITVQLEQGHPGYLALWKAIKELSIKDIKNIYKRINVDFDLWEGEMDAYPYIDKVLKILNDQKLLYKSAGAMVIDVKEDSDTEPMPPLVIVKENGGTVYQTRELATLLSRIERFKPNELWYLADNRQELYFKQVFRAAKKSGLANSDIVLNYFGFGTMNGKDGKPFKTRDGSVMSLIDLIETVKKEINQKMNPSITQEEQEKIAEIITIATIKYADFLSFRNKDYIFDVTKFADLEGKTGPYVLYSVIRMKSLLNKVNSNNKTLIHKFKNNTDRKLAVLLLSLPNVLTNSYQEKSLNGIAEYIYKLSSNYNKFYVENHVLSEQDELLKETWITLTRITYQVCSLLLDVLGISVPEKM